jgi:hypothetical protein
MARADCNPDYLALTVKESLCSPDDAFYCLYALAGWAALLLEETGTDWRTHLLRELNDLMIKAEK